MWVRCEGCRGAVYLVGTFGGATMVWAVGGPEFHRLAPAGMMARDVLRELGVLTRE